MTTKPSHRDLVALGAILLFCWMLTGGGVWAVGIFALVFVLGLTRWLYVEERLKETEPNARKWEEGMRSLLRDLRRREE